MSLVMENKVNEFMNLVRSRYYEKKLQMYSKKDIETAMFLTHPGGGAAVCSYEI